jgi:hypothetical protein
MTSFSAVLPWRVAATRPRLARALALAAIVAAGVGLATPAEARQTSMTAVPVCGSAGIPGFPCNLQSPPHNKNRYFLAKLDWLQDPLQRVKGFSYSFDYDPAVLAFNASATSLLCELRSSAVANCPTFPAGQGTAEYGASGVINEDDYAVDQSGLTITPDSSGLARVTISYTAAAPTGIAISGERNFLALAFDLVAPLGNGAIVTYSPGLLSDASLSTTSCTYTKANGDVAECDSASPSLSLKISAAPVPGPLGLAGVPALFWHSRRLRRRLG